jgi:hypothetical protein
MHLTPQQRKAKEKELEKRRKRQPLAIASDEFKKPRLAQIWLETEIAIHEISVVTGGSISDQTVFAAVERLVLQMLAGPLPPLEVETSLSWEKGKEDDLLIENIRLHWVALLQPGMSWSKEDFIGVLRSILGTINIKKSALPHSVSYLRYVAAFLEHKAGVKVQLAPSDAPNLPAAE